MAECFNCKKTLQGSWSMTSCGTAYEKTGRYLGITDGYFHYQGNPNWVYVYCYECWKAQILSLAFVDRGALSTEIADLKAQNQRLVEQLQKYQVPQTVPAIGSLTIDTSLQNKGPENDLKSYSITIEQDTHQNLQKYLEMLDFLINETKQELQEEDLNMLLIKKKISKEVDCLIRNTVQDYSSKLMIYFKELKVKAEKDAQKIQNLKNAFLECVAKTQSEDLLSQEFHAKAFEEDLKKCRIAEYEEYFQTVAKLANFTQEKKKTFTL